jgi:hypothetical protein
LATGGQVQSYTVLFGSNQRPDAQTDDLLDRLSSFLLGEDTFVYKGAEVRSALGVQKPGPHEFVAGPQLSEEAHRRSAVSL